MTLEYICAGVSILLYVIAFLLAMRTARLRAVFAFLVLAMMVQLFSIIFRWIQIQHPPIFGRYEATQAASWILALFMALSFLSIHRHFRAVVLTASPVVAGIIAYGLSFNIRRVPLTISEQSYWVDLHALFAWLAFAPLTLAFCLSLIYLKRDRKTEQETDDIYLPKKQVLDELSYRYVNFGFINHTIMFALGSYYSSVVNGTWWQWDPAESTSLITWLSLALYVHLRLFYKWQGRRAAWLMVFVFVTVLISYWGLIYLPVGSTFHVFDLDFKMVR